MVNTTSKILPLCFAVLCSGVTLAIEAEPIQSTAILRLVDEADASARSAGLIVDLLVSEGDIVKEGELLAKLDDTNAQLALEAAKLELASAKQQADNDVPIRFAKKAIEVAEAELARSEESIKKFAGSVSQSQIDVERLTADKAKLDLELAEKDLETANLEVRQRQNEFEAAQVDLERCRLRSPLSGQVVEVVIHKGAWLELGEKAFRIVSIERLKAETYLDSSIAARLQVSDQVQISGHDGRISFISPEVDPVNQQVRLLVEVSNADGKLRPGNRVTIDFSSIAEAP